MLKKIKARLKSKTVWLGISVQVLGALTLIQSNIGSLNLPAEYVGWAAVAVGTAIGILREFTKQPVDHK